MGEQLLLCLLIEKTSRREDLQILKSRFVHLPSASVGRWKKRPVGLSDESIATRYSPLILFLYYCPGLGLYSMANAEIVQDCTTAA